VEEQEHRHDDAFKKDTTPKGVTVIEPGNSLGKAVAQHGVANLTRP
jgi:hypothetical protein